MRKAALVTSSLRGDLQAFQLLVKGSFGILANGVDGAAAEVDQREGFQHILSCAVVNSMPNS